MTVARQHGGTSGSLPSGKPLQAYPRRCSRKHVLMLGVDSRAGPALDRRTVTAPRKLPVTATSSQAGPQPRNGLAVRELWCQPAGTPARLLFRRAGAFT